MLAYCDHAAAALVAATPEEETRLGSGKERARLGGSGNFKKVQFRLKNDRFSIKQTTQLGPDFRLSSFSLIQEIAGHRQQVNGKLEGNVLSYRIKSSSTEQ